MGEKNCLYFIFVIVPTNRTESVMGPYPRPNRIATLNTPPVSSTTAAATRGYTDKRHPPIRYSYPEAKMPDITRGRAAGGSAASVVMAGADAHTTFGPTTGRRGDINFGAIIKTASLFTPDYKTPRTHTTFTGGRKLESERTQIRFNRQYIRGYVVCLCRHRRRR